MTGAGERFYGDGVDQGLVYFATQEELVAVEGSEAELSLGQGEEGSGFEGLAWE